MLSVCTFFRFFAIERTYGCLLRLKLQVMSEVLWFVLLRRRHIVHVDVGAIQIAVTVGSFLVAQIGAILGRTVLLVAQHPVQVHLLLLGHSLPSERGRSTNVLRMKLQVVLVHQLFASKFKLILCDFQMVRST